MEEGDILTGLRLVEERKDIRDRDTYRSVDKSVEFWSLSRDEEKEVGGID